jgi:hypothetical protein
MSLESGFPVPSLALVSLPDRVDSWGPDVLARWSRQVAVYCANTCSLFTDDAFGITPDGSTPDEAYLRASDPSFWRRKGARALRIAQEAKQLAAGEVGKSADRRYSSSSAVDWDAHKQAATASFLKNSVLFNHDTCGSVNLSKLIKTAPEKAARYYAFLKGLEALADEANLRWAMLTITLPPEYHANPGQSDRGVAWNGITADKSHREIGEGWRRVRSALAKHGIVLSGVRTEEPQQDATPHWHCAFFYRDDAQLFQIQRAVLRQFPAGLRVRVGVPTAAGLVFTAHQFRSLYDLEAGRSHHNVREGAQCQLDLGTPKSEAGDHARSFASYVLKYVSKSVGLDPAITSDSDDSAASLIESGPAAAVRQHRETYGIRAIEFFGIPKGSSTCWDLLRQVKLDADESDDYVAPPADVAYLASVCQQPKGSGMATYLRLLGGLSISPIPAQYRVSTLKRDTTTRYGGNSKFIVGVAVSRRPGCSAPQAHIIKSGTKSIMRKSAASAVAKAQKSLGVVERVDAAAAASLVQIGTVETVAKMQQSAIQASIKHSHTVIAAAGAGKTTVLVGRASYLVSQGIAPEKIVITTFTREAAANLVNRLASAGVEGVQVGTMHGLSARWLKGSDVELDYDKLIDYSTLCGIKDKHLLMDEAQDLSEAQWSWATAHGKTVYAVGDFRQAIYGWRGAKPAGLLDQARSTGPQSDFFTDGGWIDLPFNLRSSSSIVALGNAIAGSSRPAGSIRTGGSIEVVKLATSQEELLELACWVSEALGSVAVIARTNDEVARIKSYLTLAGLASVPVLTVHASKGLEFDAVALACGKRKPSEDSDDARQTFYVAATRAKESLFISSVGEFPAVLKEALTLINTSI